MGKIISSLSSGECLVCEGCGKYPSYRTCYSCNGSGYIHEYSIIKLVYQQMYYQSYKKQWWK